MIRINRIINEYKVDNSVPIQKDVIRLDNYYRELDAAMEMKMHEELKMAQLMSIFLFDKHSGVEACMAQISFCNSGYGQAIIAIMELANAIDSTHTRHQMKTRRTRRQNFAVGKCKFGDKCKYLHKGPSPATATDKPTSKAKKNPPSYITAMHRELVGPPMGRPREGIFASKSMPSTCLRETPTLHPTMVARGTICAMAQFLRQHRVGPQQDRSAYIWICLGSALRLTIKGIPSHPSLRMLQDYLSHAHLMQRLQPLFVNLDTLTQTIMSSPTCTHLLHHLFGCQLFVILPRHSRSL